MATFLTSARNALSAALLCSGALMAEAVAAVDAAAQSALPAVSAQPGQWDMSLADTNRKCRVYFHETAAPDTAQGNARVIAMPAGCRRAMPILGNAFVWMAAGDGMTIGTKGGEKILSFASAGADTFAAKGPEGETYTLTAADTLARRQVAQIQVAQIQVPGAAPVTPPGFQTPGNVSPIAPAIAAAPPKPVVLDPPKSSAELPGRYAILRDGGKDTGCMLTLDDKARGPKGANKAQLAPACRDQGIVIFDPAGWTIEKGRLVLLARKGHNAHFDRQSGGVWMKDAKEGRSMGFRKM